MGEQWVVEKPALSPKLGVGWVKLYWRGPDDPRCASSWGPEPDASVFPTEAAAVDALRSTFSEWIPNGARAVRTERDSGDTDE